LLGIDGLKFAEGAQLKPETQ
jgi:hypothetical protein